MRQYKKLMRYSVQSRDKVFLKGQGFLTFAKNMEKNIGRNISKTLSKNGQSKTS